MNLVERDYKIAYRKSPVVCFRHKFSHSLKIQNDSEWGGLVQSLRIKVVEYRSLWN